MGSPNPLPAIYRGRLAPSPTGYLHLGHARTFWTAQQRALAAKGILILRNEDLDQSRCRPEYVSAMMEDLAWFGLRWQEGPDVGGPCEPYSQSQRREIYRAALNKLQTDGRVYPCRCSRQDVRRAAQAPHQDEDEPIYPGTCRPPAPAVVSSAHASSPHINWRFRVNDGENVTFVDRRFGHQSLIAGKDFGDFVVWRHDDIPSYHLAVVVDDAAMQITEVVRGEDLIRSTARQLLLYRALGLTPPGFYHCTLVTDAAGRRLAKRSDALSLRALRKAGAEPIKLRETWCPE